MRYYIDCELDGHNGPLLSLAMVREDGDSIHIQANVAALDIWVMEHVLPLMDMHRAQKSAKVYHNEVGSVALAFMGGDENPLIIADSAVDIARFCRAITTAADGSWNSVDGDMKFQVRDVQCYPTELEGAIQHNAWWDAMALRHRLGDD